MVKTLPAESLSVCTTEAERPLPLAKIKHSRRGPAEKLVFKEKESTTS